MTNWEKHNPTLDYENHVGEISFVFFHKRNTSLKRINKGKKKLIFNPFFGVQELFPFQGKGKKEQHSSHIMLLLERQAHALATAKLN